MEVFDDDCWRLAHFFSGERLQAELSKRGVVGGIPAPTRAQPSDALTASREARERRDARTREMWRRIAADLQEPGPPPLESIEVLVEKFGADAVETLMQKYVDPQFTLTNVTSRARSRKNGRSRCRRSNS